jgi:VanZ family protein
MGLIFVLSAQPNLPHVPGPLVDLLIKKAGHAVGFGVLFVLLWQALARRRRALGLAWTLAVLYAASDEFHQTFVPGRKGRFADVVVDAVGVSLAAAIVWWWRRRRSGG